MSFLHFYAIHSLRNLQGKLRIVSMFQISQPKMRIAVRLYEAIVGEKSEIFGVN